jgi:hypothetical protein
MNTTRCDLSCEKCRRRCNDGPVDNCTHRFDCCGVVVAHVPVVRRIRLKGAVRPTVIWIRSTTEAGYLTGPSTTKPRGTTT